VPTQIPFDSFMTNKQGQRRKKTKYKRVGLSHKAPYLSVTSQHLKQQNPLIFKQDIKVKSSTAETDANYKPETEAQSSSGFPFLPGKKKKKHFSSHYETDTGLSAYNISL